MANVVILTSSNWREWYSQVERLLGASKRADLITKRYEEVAGDELTAEETAKLAEMNENIEKENDAEGKKKLQAKLKDLNLVMDKLSDDERAAQCGAMFAIDQTVSAEDKKLLVNCKTVRQQLAMLKRHRVKPETVYQLTDELHSMHWGAGESAVQFTHRLTDLKNRLQQAKGGVDDESSFVAKLVRELPKTMNFTRLKIEDAMSDGETFEYRPLVEKIQKAYLKMLGDKTRKDGDRTDGERSYRQNANRNNTNSNASGSSFWTSRKKCHVCGSVYHLAANCPDKNKRNNNGTFNSRYQQVMNQTNQSRSASGAGQQPNQSNQQSGQQPQQNRGQQQQNNGNNQNQTSSQNGNRQSGERAAGTAGQASTQTPNSLAGIINQARINNAFVRRQFAVGWKKLNETVSAEQNELDADQFIHDNGSSVHLVNDRGAFVEYKEFTDPAQRKLESVGGGEALGIGTVKVVSIIRKTKIPFELTGVLYCPTSPVNIFSERAARARGLTFKMTEDDRYDYLAGYAECGTQLTNARSSKMRPEVFSMSLFIQPRVNYQCYLLDWKWHSVLVHADHERIRRTQKCVDGMQIERSGLPARVSCEPCCEYKMKRRTFDHTLLKERTPGHTWHCDVAEMTTSGIFGQKRNLLHMLVFACEASRYVKVYFLKDQTADNIANAFRELVNWQRAELRYGPSRVHHDKGTGLMSEIMDRLRRENGMDRETSTAHNHPQNGLVEKVIQDFRAAERTQRGAVGAPARMWPEAVNNAAVCMNVTWKRSIDTTPHQAFFGRKPNLCHMKAAWGDQVYVRIDSPVDRRRAGEKLGPQAWRGIFVGYTKSSVIFRIANSSYTRITEETNVQFLKHYQLPPVPDQMNVLISPDLLMPIQPGSTTNGQPENGQQSAEGVGERSVDGEPDQSNAQNQLNAEQGEVPVESVEQIKIDYQEEQTKIDSKEKEPLAKQNEGDRRREDREKKEPLAGQQQGNQPEKDHQGAAGGAAVSGKLPRLNVYDFLIRGDELEVPKSLADVQRSELREFWEEAMDAEFSAFIYHELFDLVDPVPEKEVLRGHWVFSKKTDETGFVSALKARWVVDGSKLTDCSLYAPVVDLKWWRLLVAWAVENGYEIDTVDADNAYLNSSLEEPVYMKQVTGYKDPKRPLAVCRLNKALYGLPQSAASWYTKMTTSIRTLAFHHSIIDPCIHYEPETKSVISSHVDDLTIIAGDDLAMQVIKDAIGEQFRIKDQGHIRRFVGIEIVYDKQQRKLWMRQMEKIEKAYGMMREKPKKTIVPIQPNTNLYAEMELYDDPHHYRSLMGLLNYIATISRPDVAFPASQLARFMREPTKLAYTQLCRVITYLYETRTNCLVFKKNPEIETDSRIHTFTDCGEPDLLKTKGRRTTGIVQTYKLNVIGWQSKRQSAISADICEGELVALNAGLRLSIGARNLLDELGLLNGPEDLQIALYGDNKTSVSIANEGFKGATHYDRSLLFVKEYIENRQLSVHKVNSSENLADLMTKFCQHTAFRELIRLFGFEEFPAPAPGRSGGGQADSVHELDSSVYVTDTEE